MNSADNLPSSRQAPANTAALLAQAAAFHQGGKLAEAERGYLQILALAPDHFQAQYSLGILRQQQGRHQEAVALIASALKADPNHAQAHYNLGIALMAVKRSSEAIASYDKAIALRPDYAEAHYNRGNALLAVKRAEDALASYDRAIALRPDHPPAHANRGNALALLKRPVDALASYDKATALAGNDPAAHFNRANVLLDLERAEEALTAYDKALALKPDHGKAHHHRALALMRLRRVEQALASYERAIALDRHNAEIHCNRGLALFELGRVEEAVASHDKAIALKPDHAAAHYERGNALMQLGRFKDALVSYQRTATLLPDHEYALGAGAYAALNACDWSQFDAMAHDVRTHVAENRSVIQPTNVLCYGGDPSLELQAARSFGHDRVKVAPEALWKGAVWRNDKIRVAYLSADFRRHAVAHLIVGLMERHDRSRFELIGVSFGVDDASELRTRLVACFDQFIDVRTKSDQEVARLIAELRVDIAVDLMGYTKDSRPGILAFRPAPSQVSYLGYPSTMGVSFIDYIMADATIIPADRQRFFTEKVVTLPDCYQPHDDERTVASRTPSRAELGLPPHGFVFCAFHNSWKITPPLFDVWMRLLRGVEGSVLWLSRYGSEVEANLRRAAAARGIDPARLVFAGRLPRMADHLARHRAADLFLDTLPYNAHATANDALWAGLPVLTCAGESFAGRVAASLLEACGLPELATHSLDEYETLALRLAREPSLLGDLRQRLEQNRSTCRLFDNDRLRQNIEKAYTTMWELWQRGEGPRSFSVDP